MARTYTYDAAWERERDRLAGIEAVWDPGTARAFDALPVRPGWRCLEVGAGGGSMAVWLTERVTEAGTVVATDLDTRFIEPLDLANLEVRRHDIATDDLEEGEFDLVHARLLLAHVQARDEALKRMAAALKPGGWLVVEDFDWGPALDTPSSRALFMPTSAAKLFQKAVRSVLALMGEVGYDAEFGRWLPAELRAQGLIDVAAEGRSYMIRGASPDGEFYRLSLAALRDRLVERGALTVEEMDGAERLLDDPLFATMTPVMVAAWGRRPSL